MSALPTSHVPAFGSIPDDAAQTRVAASLTTNAPLQQPTFSHAVKAMPALSSDVQQSSIPSASTLASPTTVDNGAAVAVPKPTGQTPAGNPNGAISGVITPTALTTNNNGQGVAVISGSSLTFGSSLRAALTTDVEGQTFAIPQSDGGGGIAGPSIVGSITTNANGQILAVDGASTFALGAPGAANQQSPTAVSLTTDASGKTLAVASGSTIPLSNSAIGGLIPSATGSMLTTVNGQKFAVPGGTTYALNASSTAGGKGGAGNNLAITYTDAAGKPLTSSVAASPLPSARKANGTPGVDSKEGTTADGDSRVKTNGATHLGGLWVETVLLACLCAVAAAL